MALGSESTAEEAEVEEAGPQDGFLCVHAYGRLEEVTVQPLTLKKLRQAAQEVFDLPDTDMIFKGPDGACADDEMLKNLASVYLELPDGGLHDLEQRIDQLQHMQVSHVCDRLATLADEQVSHQASIAGLTDALIEEQAFRQEFEEAVRAEIKHECDGVSLHLKKRMDELELKMREHLDESLHAMESRVSQDFQDLWQWTSDECRQCNERLKDLEQRVICSSATAREASASITALRSARLEAGQTVKDCLEGQAKISARLDDLCDALVKEVQERLAQARGLQEELSRHDEHTESLKGLGQELHTALTTLRSQPEVLAAEGLRELRQHVETWRQEQRSLQEAFAEEVAVRAKAEAQLTSELAWHGESLQALRATLQGMATRLEEQTPGRSEDSESPQNAISQLREECLDSIQREVRSRLQDSAKLRQALEMESKSRKEAFGMIQRAVSQCGS